MMRAIKGRDTLPEMQTSGGRTLRDTDRGGSEVLLQTFVQWNFD